MSDISNRTLAFLLIAALVISLGGTLVSLTRLEQVKHIGITGFAGTNTTRGNVSVTIQDVTWINFSTKKCNWGTGYVLKGTCWMNGSWKNATSCAPSWSSTACTTGLILKNVGNNNVSLNLTWSNNSAFLTGTGASLQFKVLNGSTSVPTSWSDGGCTRGLSAGTWNMTKFNNIWRNVTAARSNMTCDRFTFATGRQTITIHVLVGFTQSATSGFKQVILTAVGETKVG
jgi:hypothetical protein